MMEISEAKLFEMIHTIRELDSSAVEKAKARQMILAKPPGSLGKLEDISVQIAGITGKIKNSAGKKCIVIMSADNGVADEGVASAPQAVTAAQTMNFTRRLTGVGTLAKHFNVDLLVVDVGIKEHIPEEFYTEEICDCFCSGEISSERITNRIINRKIRRGTSNFAKGPAMTREEAVRAIETGIEMAEKIHKMGYNIFGVGEMGIGNTTTSAAVLSALTGLPAGITVGKGGGINDESFKRKKEIVHEACERNGFNTPDIDVIDVLSKVGGFDIAAMTGAFIGAAVYRIPVVIDGYISAVAALAASMLAPKTKAYMLASHQSFEKGYGFAIEKLGLKPMLNLEMRLGEGSGCPLAFQIIEGACSVMCDMATFEEAAINDDYLEEIRKGDCF